MSETTLSDLEFENREYELGRIANPAGPPLIVVDAPPEYGKTRILKKVEEMYKPKEEEERGEQERWKADWKCVLIDLAQQEYAGDQQAILEAISIPVADERMKGDTAYELAEYIAGQSKEVLLLFDAADCREQETKWLVHNVIPELVGTLRFPGRRLRAVFAGRYISWRGWAWPHYITIELSEFDEANVLRMILRTIERLDPALRPKMGSDDAEKLAREVTFLSGGHPGSIKEILLDLQRRNWAIRFDNNRGLLPPQMRQELFGYANRKAKEILKHVPKETQGALKTLSIFRRFNVNIIQELQTRSKISGVSSSPGPLELLAQLTNTGLVRGPAPTKPFYSDGIIRNLLLVQMQFTEPQRYLQLNQLACEIYDAWIESKGLGGNDLRGPTLDDTQVTCMVESFYYFLHCQEEGPSLNEVEEKLEGYAPKLKSAWDSPESIGGLKQQLRSSLLGDSDIQRRLRDLFGENEANALLDRALL